MNQPAVILSIAGSDPSGGAGIQADIKTISALGGYAAAIPTAITVQNTMGVQSLQAVASSSIADQLEAVLTDLQPDAIKIGMLPDENTAAILVHSLTDYRKVPIVFDPVIKATDGTRLSAFQSSPSAFTRLFQLCTLITPNLGEAEAIVGWPVRTLEDMEQTAQELSRRQGCAVLVKGGHLSGAEAVDILFDGTIHIYRSPHIATHNLHGTGCTLSSAIATLLGQGHELPQAVHQAKIYMNRAIIAARHWHIGRGQGPLCHFPPEDIESNVIYRQKEYKP